VNPRFLGVRLPSRSYDTLRREAKQIQTAFPLADGASVRVNTILNALAACVGYRSFSELQTWSDNEKCACISVSESELRRRQRIREIMVMSQLLPDASPRDIVKLVNSLDLVNWGAVHQAEDLGGADPRPAACPLSRKPATCVTPRLRDAKVRCQTGGLRPRAASAPTPLWQRCLQHEVRLRRARRSLEITASLCEWRRSSSPTVRPRMAKPCLPCPSTSEHNVGSRI
jgi:hypothetical protein